MFTVHADRLRLFIVTIGQDQGSELSTFDASGIQALGVFANLKATPGIMAIDDGGAFLFGKEGLIFVPNLRAVSMRTDFRYHQKISIEEQEHDTPCSKRYHP